MQVRFKTELPPANLSHVSLVCYIYGLGVGNVVLILILYKQQIALTGITAPVPGGLQRFSLVLNVTSSARPGEHRLSAIKGMVTDSLRAWWTQYAPVVVASLPYHGYAPVRPAAWAKAFPRVFCCHGDQARARRCGQPALPWLCAGAVPAACVAS